MSRRIEPTDYLFGELDAQGMAEAERLLAEDPAFRDEVDQLRPIIGALDELPEAAWDAAEPPALQHPGTVGGPSIIGRLLAPIRIPAPALGLAAALVLLAGVVVGATLFDGSSDDSPSDGGVLALAAVGESRGVGEARLLDDGTQLSVAVQGLSASADNEVYEVWLLTEPQRLLALGSFRVDESGAGSIVVPLPVDVASFESIDVSREPLDGDPSHSADSVLRGPTV